MIYIVAALPASRSLFKGYFRNLVLELLSWLRKACPLIPDWLFLIIISSTKDVPTVKEVEQHGGLASALYTHRYVFLSYVASFVIVGEWFIKYTVRFCTLSRISDDPEQHGTLFVTVDSVQASSIKFTPQLWFTVVDLVIGYWQYFLLVSFSYPTPCSVWFPYFHSRPAVVCAVWDVPVHKESHPSFLSSEHCGTNQIMLNNSAAVMILKCSLSYVDSVSRRWHSVYCWSEHPLLWQCKFPLILLILYLPLASLATPTCSWVPLYAIAACACVVGQRGRWLLLN